MWGLAITTEPLHDRDKSAWWLLVFYGGPAMLGQMARVAWFPGPAGTALRDILALAGFVTCSRNQVIFQWVNGH
jgi:uncharacterized membrane protein YhaH (DUF805 family)